MPRADAPRKIDQPRATTSRHRDGSQPRYRPFGSDPGWLAAYAAALTRTAVPDEQRVAALVKVTDAHLALLEAAIARLGSSPVRAGCPSEEALALLEQAVARVRADATQVNGSPQDEAEWSAR